MKGALGTENATSRRIRRIEQSLPVLISKLRKANRLELQSHAARALLNSFNRANTSTPIWL